MIHQNRSLNHLFARLKQQSEDREISEDRMNSEAKHLRKFLNEICRRDPICKELLNICKQEKVAIVIAHNAGSTVYGEDRALALTEKGFKLYVYQPSGDEYINTNIWLPRLALRGAALTLVKNGFTSEKAYNALLEAADFFARKPTEEKTASLSISRIIKEPTASGCN